MLAGLNSDYIYLIPVVVNIMESSENGGRSGMLTYPLGTNGMCQGQRKTAELSEPRSLLWLKRLQIFFD